MLLLTGWCGTEHGMMAALTAPLMDRYAKKHGMHFACVNLQADLAPPSWMKVPYLIGALATYEAVCWIDADVVIAKSDKSIFDDVPAEAWQGVVEHETECGTVPNCGVWVVRRAMAGTLEEIWRDGLPKYRNHPWWEQAATIERMGYSVYLADGCTKSSRIEDTPLFERTALLPSEWNDHPFDRRRNDPARFVHVTHYDDRLDAIRRLCDAAT